MIRKLQIFSSQSSSPHTKLWLVALLSATILLVSCPLLDFPQEPPVSAPANLTILAGNGRGMLSWDDVAGAVTYRIYRNSAETPLATDLINTTYTDDTITNDTEYTYTVRAVGSTGLKSPHSDEATATPGVPPVAPANLTFTTGDGTVTLTWAVVDGATSYHVYRGGELIETDSPITDTTHTDIGLTNGIEYRYTVRAVNSSSRESGNSDEVSATPPAAPRNLWDDLWDNFWGNGIVGEVELFWSTVRGAATYHIYRNGTFLVMVAGSVYTDTDVTNGTAYTYTMQALDSTGVVVIESVPLVVTPPSTVDFDTLANSGNLVPGGIWSDGATMWVSDVDDKKLYAYRMSDESRDPAKDLTLAPGHRLPRGIWANADTMWVVNGSTGTIDAYNRNNKSRNPSQDFTSLNDDGILLPMGIWSDGTTMWVSSAYLSDIWELDTGSDKLHAYNLETKERDPAKDIDTLVAAGNEQPHGIWSDGITMWVTNDKDDKIYAYNLISGKHVPAQDFRIPAQDFNTLAEARNAYVNNGRLMINGHLLTHIHALWANETTRWVLDAGNKRLYAYDLESTALIP